MIFKYDRGLTREPLISVIIPIFKVELYLRECLDSIIHQTYQNLEIILVDDGSPDTCGLICDEYAKLDRRIKVIHQENKGLSAARNIGLDIMKGDYITFVDSDDFVSVNYIEFLYGILRSSNCDLSMCGVVRLFDHEVFKAPPPPLPR